MSSTHRRLAAALSAVSLAITPGLGLAQGKKGPPASVAAPAPTPAFVPAASPEAVGFDRNRLAKLDAYMQGVVSEGRVAGMTTFLARHGKVVEFKTYGKKSLAT